MYLYYFAEYSYGDSDSVGPFSHFALDFDWNGQNTQFGCNESVWMIPGTVQS